MELKNIVILFDADNTTEMDVIGKVIDQVSLHGNIAVKRAYGNWNKDCLKNWKDACLKYAIHPIQQFDYVKGKNASDIALVIDAMNLLHKGMYDGFAIVASDSDYTPLAIELREHGITTFGFGRKNAVDSFKKSCMTFYALEDLRPSHTPSNSEIKNEKNDLDLLFESAWEEYKNDDDYALLNMAGDFITRVKPDFRVKNYNAKSLSDYVSRQKALFEVKAVKKNGATIYYYKCKL